MPAAPLAYSYVRFSSPEQAKGDSIRRQTELRDAWLLRHSVQLDTSTTLSDKGKSAFTGEHRKNPDRHALAAFLKLVETGKIPRGSYLIVESLDRLTREHITPALLLFLSLLHAGVRVVQLLPVEQVFDDKSEPMQIMMALMELARGNFESRVKSERIGSAWRRLKQKAAAEKVPITRNAPKWLKVEGGKFVALPARVAVVKRIFRLATAGESLVSIARKFSAEGVPTFGRAKQWPPGTLHRIIRERAALGEYQPKTKQGAEDDGEPIPGFYPAVVTEAQWHAAQSSLSGRYLGGRRTSSRVHNPFSGLLVDARDGERIYLAKCGKLLSNTILVNHAAMTGKPGAKYVSFPLKPFVECALAVLKEVHPSDIVDEEDGSPDHVAVFEERKRAIENRIVKLQAAIEGAGEVAPAMESLKRLVTHREEVDQLLTAERQRTATPPAVALSDAHSLIEVFRHNDTDETRARLKVVLRRLVSRVVCLFVARGRTRLAAVRIQFAGTDRHRDLLISYTQGSGNTTTKTPASWFVVANARTMEDGKFDLTDKQHVAIVEQHLETVDLGSLEQVGRFK